MDEEKEQHNQWRKLVPLLYDWFAHHALTWPTLTCRWGPVIEEGVHRRKQHLYLSEQTDGSEPNKLVVVVADVCKPRIAAADSIQAFSAHTTSPFVSRPVTTLVHPGEVNKLRELPTHPHVVVTHTDAPQLNVWNLRTQPDRGSDKGASAKQPSSPDLVLAGHTQNAEFALAASSAAPVVASGGKDCKVLTWNLEDHPIALSASSTGLAPARSEVQPRSTFVGHAATVEDVTFCPGTSTQLASVGDDFCLLLWDSRTGADPTLRVAEAHGRQDVHCVDWSALRPDLLVTGAADGSLKVWDRRKLDAPTFTFLHHAEAAMCVEWCPNQPGVFASSSEDRLICIWDLDAKVADADGPAAAKQRQRAPAPPQLLFQHAGHRAGVVDFQWNPHEPWTLVSASDEAGEGGGGTLQVWRVSDLIHRPEEVVVQELEPYRDYIITGHESALRKMSSEIRLPHNGFGEPSVGGTSAGQTADEETDAQGAVAAMDE